jgi:hypothetical protein
MGSGWLTRVYWGVVVLLMSAVQYGLKPARWMFADRVIYAFWAGLPVPPELAVIP